MNKENIEFLKDLQHELITQTDDGNAAPVFWVVAENKREYGYDDDYCDGVVMCDAGGETWDTPKEFLDSLIEYDYISKNDINKDHNYSFEEIMELIDYDSDFYTCNYQNRRNEIAPNTFFITKRECKKHIQLNDYHYEQPHTYAMTAWRSPEFERFINLFKNMDLNKLDS